MKENPKFEYRNSKQIQMTKIQMTKTRPLRGIYKKFLSNFFQKVGRRRHVLNFEHLKFGFVSDFGFRASDLFKNRRLIWMKYVLQ